MRNIDGTRHTQAHSTDRIRELESDFVGLEFEESLGAGDLGDESYEGQRRGNAKIIRARAGNIQGLVVIIPVLD